METIAVTHEILGAGTKACRKVGLDDKKISRIVVKYTPEIKSSRFLPASDQRALQVFFPAAAQTLRDILGR